MLAQDLGTVCILGLGLLAILIRVRYWCTYGRHALVVLSIYVMISAVVRLSIDMGASTVEARHFTGWLAGTLILIQVENVVLAESERRARMKAKIPDNIDELLEQAK